MISRITYAFAKERQGAHRVHACVRQYFIADMAKAPSKTSRVEEEKKKEKENRKNVLSSYLYDLCP